jgi:SNF2 family DNA or RNA helicase
MNDGRLLRISNEEELQRFIMMLESFHERENGVFEGKVYNAPELENIFTSSEYYNASRSKGFSAFIKEAKSGKPVKKVRKPVLWNNTLRDYQKSGLDWLYFLRKYRFAGILADDMGLGKTAQALALLDMNKSKEKPSIVIAPKTLLYNWKEEVEKFAPKMKAVVVDGLPKERLPLIKKAQKQDLVITSYSVLQKDLPEYKKEKITFNYCVLDEAQFIKNHKTKNARVVKEIDADYRLSLTGTPLENSVSELWSIFRNAQTIWRKIFKPNNEAGELYSAR